MRNYSWEFIVSMLLILNIPETKVTAIILQTRTCFHSHTIILKAKNTLNEVSLTAVDDGFRNHTLKYVSQIVHKYPVQVYEISIKLYIH